MKDFLIVLKFELLGFLKNRAFKISTIIICAILIVGLSIPTVIEAFSSSEEEEISDVEQGEEQENYVKNTYGYINKNTVIPNIKDLEQSFSLGELVEFKDEDELEDNLTSGEIEAGFIVESPTKYQYIVNNNEMVDSNRAHFEEALIRTYRINGFEERGIVYSDVEELIAPNVESSTRILGKDSAGNYMYTYILVFVLYFVIIVYGQMIATSIASEKSNRAMEVLVTSTDSKNLIFGKVLGTALAGTIQVGLIIIVAILTYNFNAAAWNNSLDFIFEIPREVLLTFSGFGILGYLFYSFIYGALGALVSRTEDVSSSSTPITIIFIAVFFMAMMGMYDTEGLLLKVTSFIPFSSFMSMFIRVSMGSVTIIEVVVSLAILVVSTILIGIFTSKIYRMGTLMYGNPIKLKKAIKLLRDK